MPGSDPNERRETVLLALGCSIVAVWILLLLVQTVFPSRQVPTEVHAVILILIPLLFGSAWLTARKQVNGGNGA